MADPVAVRAPIPRPPRLADEAVIRIRDRILSGELQPGQRLVQDQLAAQLGVSRTPLRDAIRTLQAEGLVTVSPSGSTVTVTELDERDAIDIHEVRASIDGLAARLAAGRDLPDSVRHDLRTACTETKAAAEAGDLKSFLLLNAQFHGLVLEASGNRYLVAHAASVVRMSSFMWFSRLSGDASRIRQSAEEHEEILDAILAEDGTRAQRAAERHIGAALRYWRSGEP